MNRIAIVSVVVVGLLVFVAGMGVGNWILDRRGGETAGRDIELGALSDGDGGVLDQGDSRDGGDGEGVTGCGRPPRSAGPASDPDNDGISSAVESNPANRERCLDPELENDDPSRAVGSPASGHIEGGLNLPDAPPDAAYVHEPNTDPVDSDDWGTASLLGAIESAASCWDGFRKEFRPGHGRMVVLDLSLNGGGPWSDHKSHQNGLDADVRYVRRDGKESRLNIRSTPAAHDDVASLELIKCFTDSSFDLDLVLVDDHLWETFIDWTPGKIIRPAGGHRDHFHVRLKAPSADVAKGPGARLRAALARATERTLQAVRELRVAAASVPLLAALAPAPLHAAQQQIRPSAVQQVDVKVAARVQSDSELQVVDMQTRQTAVVYRAPDAVIREMAVAPSERYIALLEQPRAATAATPPSPRLVIMNPDGKAVKRPPEPIQRFTWSVDARRPELAAIEGESREGGIGFTPRALLVVNPANGRAERVATPGQPVDMAYARHDGALYVEMVHEVDGARVFRRDPRTGRFLPTRLRSVNLSPSGRFALHEGDEVESRTAVFDAGSGAVVEVPRELGTPRRWIGTNGNLVLLERGRKEATSEKTPSGIQRARYVVEEQIIYDVERKAVVRRVAPDTTGWRVAHPVLIQQTRIDPRLLQSFQSRVVRPPVSPRPDTGG